MARLIIQRSGSDETVAIPPDKSAFVIGRAPGCDLVIDDTASSRRHCQVERDGGGHRLVDLKSSNGTRLNGAKVDSAPLKDGDAIQIGNAVIRFHADAADVSEILLEEPAGGATFILKIRGGDRDGESVPLPPGKHTVGRSPKNSIVVVTTGVSGVHAEIRVEGLSAAVKDLGSTNGTFVNGSKVSDSPLAHGDTVRFGGQTALFVDTARAAIEETASAPADSSAAPLVDSVRDVDVPRRRGAGLLVALALLAVLGGGAAAYVYLPRYLPGAAGEKAARPAVHSADNRVPEGAWSFEGESSPTAWRVRGTGAPAGPRVGESDAASGIACLSLSLPDTATEPTAVELAEPIAVSTARAYRLTARARRAGSGGTGGAGILLAWTGAGSDGVAAEISLDASDVKALDRGEWTELSVAATPPRSASSVRPALLVAGGGAAFVFDDVVLAEVADGAAAAGASFSAGEAEIRSGPKGDLSASRGVRALFHDLVPVATVAARASEEGAGEPAALSTLTHGAVESSSGRGEAGKAEWTIALLGATEPVAVKETLESRPSGFSILLEWPRGARAVTASGLELRIDASQEPVFTLVGDAGAETLEGELSRPAVRDVIVGRVSATAGQAEPFRVRFEPPAAVRVARGEDGALRLAATAGAGDRLEATVQTTFVEERNEALALRDAMKKAEDSRRWGAALGKAEAILQELPFHDGAIADATSAVARLREKGEADAKHLEETRRDVEFLPTRATLGALIAEARAAADGWTGTRYAERATAVADACRERLAAMETSASKGEAARLEERAADLEASGHPGLARKLRSAAEKLGAGAAREPEGGEGGSEKSSGGGGR